MPLLELRTNPNKAISKYGFMVKSPEDKGPEGGPCAIRSTLIDTKNNIYKLEIINGDRDYYYPYQNGTGADQGVGHCSVPIGACQNGTIVLTGGMNGCSLEVYKNGENFDFYHNLNDKYLDRRNPQGTRVCHVPFKSYAGILSLGEILCAEIKTTKIQATYEHTIITVLVDDKWHVLGSAIIHTFDRIKGVKLSYEKFFPTPCNLLTSFEDVV
jgi:hypothetical protein